METTFGEFSSAISAQAGAFASAWSQAGKTFSDRVAAEGGEAIVSAMRQSELYAQSIGDSFRSLAASSERWAASAAAQGNAGIAEIMGRYAEQYAAKATALLDPLISAEARVAALAAEAINPAIQ